MTLSTIIIEQNAELEQEMIQRGHERYERRQEKQTPSQREVPHQLITEALPRVSEAIEEELIRQQDTCRRGRTRAYTEELQGLDFDKLAFIGLNSCYETLIRSGSLAGCLITVGARIENERWALGLQDYDKSLFKRLVSQVTKNHSSERYRLRAAKNIATKAGFKFDKWSRQLKVSVASPILSEILEHSGLFELVETSASVKSKGRVSYKTIRTIGLTRDAEVLLNQRMFDASWAEPMFGPLLIPPKPWTSLDTGVYDDPWLASLVPLVRRSNAEQKRAIAKDFEAGIPLYVKALNALQATPLRINKRVLDVVEWCSQEKLRFGKFPDLEPHQFPKLPDDYESLPEETVSQIRRDQKQWHTKRREIIANVAVMYDDLRTARRMSKHDKFYIGWSLDFRARMYPVSNFNYHRDDHCKAMFELANGKPIKEEDRGWLAIHLANVGDFNKISKASLEDRIQWCLDNEDWLRSINDNPQGTFDQWVQSDKPFQFLAAVFAYFDPSEVCHIPVSLDGTNSGVQHYACCTKSEGDAYLTNLVPSDSCQDIYQVVADEVKERLAESPDPEAAKWLDFGITRSTCKRNVMTFSYSSVERGFGDQIIEDLMQPLQRDVHYGKYSVHPFGDFKGQEDHARYLARYNYAAVQKVISGASQGMTFLQSYADALAREGKSVRWRTPSGFPVVQQYKKSDMKRVKVFLYDREAKLKKQTRVSLCNQGVMYDTRKSRAAVAPNFIHSMDSSHMHLSIATALDNGITDFFLIHDAFGTTAAETWTFYHCIRHAMVDMYDNNCVFSSYEAECRQRLADPDMDLEPVPPKGTFDVRSILESEYCFS